MPVLYSLLLALLLVGGIAVAQRVQLATERAAHAATKADQQMTLANIAKATASAAVLARKAAEDYQTDLAQARTDTRQEMSDALEVERATVTDLRTGNRRLRQHWQGCIDRGNVPGDAGTGPGADAGASLRNQGAGDLVGAGAQADAWIRGLQRELISAYKLCGPPQL